MTSRSVAVVVPVEQADVTSTHQSASVATREQLDPMSAAGSTRSSDEGHKGSEPEGTSSNLVQRRRSSDMVAASSVTVGARAHEYGADGDGSSITYTVGDVEAQGTVKEGYTESSEFKGLEDNADDVPGVVPAMDDADADSEVGAGGGSGGAGSAPSHVAPQRDHRERSRLGALSSPSPTRPAGGGRRSSVRTRIKGALHAFASLFVAGRGDVHHESVLAAEDLALRVDPWLRRETSDDDYVAAQAYVAKFSMASHQPIHPFCVRPKDFEDLPDSPCCRTPALCTATFGVGLLWEAEALFGRLPGVVATKVGFAGGRYTRPTMAMPADHAQVVQVTFDSGKISYMELLAVFWHGHDPTSCPEVSDWSCIFVRDRQQLAQARKTMQRYQATVPDTIRTAILPDTAFVPAEQSLQHYYVQQVPELAAAFEKLSPDEWVNSTRATRVNAFLAGYGSVSDLKATTPTLGLTHAQQVLLASEAADARWRRGSPSGNS